MTHRTPSGIKIAHRASTALRMLFGAIVICLTVATSDASAEETPEPQKERPRLLVLDLSGESVAEQERRTLTSLIGVELSTLVDYDVVTARDIEKLMTVEKDRQMVGCVDASCLAEIADAMGTERVVFGEIGKLGTSYLMTLSLFDSLQARATQRVVIKADAVEVFAEKMNPALRKLCADLLSGPVAAAEVPADAYSDAPEVDEAANAPTVDEQDKGGDQTEADNDGGVTPAAESGDALMPILGWSAVGVGGAVALGGMAFDVFSPSSSDAAFGIEDFLGPSIVFVGAGLAATGLAVTWLVSGSDAPEVESAAGGQE